MQVLVVTAANLQALPPFHNVRHLAVEELDLQCVLEGLHNFPMLETLLLINPDRRKIDG
jgi:hypothetical protein